VKQINKSKKDGEEAKAKKNKSIRLMEKKPHLIKNLMPQRKNLMPQNKRFRIHERFQQKGEVSGWLRLEKCA
jgi:hypothetical protein